MDYCVLPTALNALSTKVTEGKVVPMKVQESPSDGIELVPETDFEREALGRVLRALMHPDVKIKIEPSSSDLPEPKALVDNLGVDTERRH